MMIFMSGVVILSLPNNLPHLSVVSILILKYDRRLIVIIFVAFNRILIGLLKLWGPLLFTIFLFNISLMWPSKGRDLNVLEYAQVLFSSTCSLKWGRVLNYFLSVSTIISISLLKGVCSIIRIHLFWTSM